MFRLHMDFIGISLTGQITLETTSQGEGIGSVYETESKYIIDSRLTASTHFWKKKKILKRWLGFSRDLGCVSRRQAAEQSTDRVRGTAAPLMACTHLQPDAGVVRHLVGKETQPGHLRAAWPEEAI